MNRTFSVPSLDKQAHIYILSENNLQRTPFESRASSNHPVHPSANLQILCTIRHGFGSSSEKRFGAHVGPARPPAGLARTSATFWLPRLAATSAVNTEHDRGESTLGAPTLSAGVSRLLHHVSLHPKKNAGASCYFCSPATTQRPEGSPRRAHADR